MKVCNLCGFTLCARRRCKTYLMSIVEFVLEFLHPIQLCNPLVQYGRIIVKLLKSINLKTIFTLNIPIYLQQ